MVDEIKEKQALLQELREEMEKLLCSDSVSEDEKVDRMNKALAIIERENRD
ncbi:MAG: hypothetical protein ACK5HO_06215 [Pseudomonadota bacterium]|jgi:hypothetical protein